jgi:hypothetical protein
MRHLVGLWHSQIDRDTLLLGLFAADMLLLPMFHIGPVPFKLGYLLILWRGPAVLPRPIFVPLWVLCGGIAMMGWIGSVYLWSIEDSAEFGQTIRNTAIFLLVPLAFAFGWRTRARSFRFLLWLPLVYFAVNVALTYWYAQLPWLIWFYGLEDRVSSGLFDIRSPGIHYNPNLSALAANLLMLALAAADRAGLLGQTRASWRVAAFASVIGTHLLMGSRGEMLSAFAIGGCWLFYRTGGLQIYQLRRAVLTAIIVVPIVAVTLVFALDALAERNPLVSFVRTQFTSTLTILPSDFTDPNARTNSILLRPFFEGERAFDRISRSPIWGTGFDTAAVYPYDNVHFHNDWALLFVAGGLLGFVLFGLLVAFTGSFAGVYLIPFLVTAPSNSFILAPQHLLFYFALLGAVAAAERQRAAASAPQAHELVR